MCVCVFEISYLCEAVKAAEGTLGKYKDMLYVLIFRVISLLIVPFSAVNT